MAEEDSPPITVEMSLAIVSEAMWKASDDLAAARARIDVARMDIGSWNTTVSRKVIKDAERVIDHLRQTDECLKDVLQDLSERD